MEIERDNYKDQLDTAKEQLKEFEGVDVNELQSKIKTLTSDLETKDTEYQQKIADMEFNSVLDGAISKSGAKNTKAVKALLDFKEVNLFLRGMVPLVGFKSSTVAYDRAPRLAGESKYPLKKMLTFAFDGITSFSIRPIRFITALGGITLILSVIFAIYALISYFVHNTVPGWTSTVLSIWFFGSLQLIATGVVGEYIGKIYLEAKGRPRFFIEKYLK